MKYLIEEATLTDIADAIRDKAGTTDLIQVSDLANAITNLPSGGGEAEPIVLSGNCQSTCSGKLASTYITQFGNTISTSNITNSKNMFQNSTVKKIPFALNYSSGTSLEYTFNQAYYLEEIPTMNNVSCSSTNYLFQNCNRLRKLPDNFGDDWDWTKIHSSGSSNISSMFSGCYSLRSIPDNFMSNLYGPNPVTSYTLFYWGFQYCYVLDEIKGLKVPSSSINSNCFQQTFIGCSRVKDITFALNENGSVQTANLSRQTIDLTQNVGYGIYTGDITMYNSGISVDKYVKDDATYQVLKDDPDYFTSEYKYSRYNHTSAVNTINSLPDTSAYVASTGYANTIKFYGNSGSATDGGAINTLTEEEIAVATAKGWTVSLS